MSQTIFPDGDDLPTEVTSEPITNGLATPRALAKTLDTAQQGDLIPAARLPFVASPETHRRLRRFLDFAHANAAVYSLGQIPTRVKWGPLPLDHVLHDTVVGHPVRIWVVGIVMDLLGRLTSTGYAGSINPESTTMLRLSLLRAADGADMERLIQMGSRKPWFDKEVFECGISYTSAWHNQGMFTGVYDATHAFRSKELMPRMGLSSIIRGDIVLAECYCIRSPELVGQGVPGGPFTWRVWFEIGSISLLAMAPRMPMSYVPDTFTGCM
ncbi:hypothetical protein C2E23DRAFT_882797 [Lenzites betulinus]|nr:hypothetical protein C2E23DRAFT_882797 [Lenzites betulinus]